MISYTQLCDNTLINVPRNTEIYLCVPPRENYSITILNKSSNRVPGYEINIRLEWRKLERIIRSTFAIGATQPNDHRSRFLGTWYYSIISSRDVLNKTFGVREGFINAAVRMNIFLLNWLYEHVWATHMIGVNVQCGIAKAFLWFRYKPNGILRLYRPLSNVIWSSQTSWHVVFRFVSRILFFFSSFTTDIYS